MPFIKINGAQLYYEDQGAGPETIVFAHSLLYSCRMFDKQVDAFKDRYRCVTFDFRGQGRSEVTDNGYDMDTLADDAAELIRQLACAPCHFLGFSMGGFVGLRLAVHQPALLRSLILVSTSADPEPRDHLPKYKLLNFLTRWFGPWAVARQVMPIMFSKGFLTDPVRAQLREEWRQHFLNNDRTGVTRAVNGVIYRDGIYDLLPNITVPTLIMAGENDIATTPDRSERMRTQIPNAQMVTIPRTGHMSPVEEPDAVNTALTDFLAGLARMEADDETTGLPSVL